MNSLHVLGSYVLSATNYRHNGLVLTMHQLNTISFTMLFQRSLVLLCSILIAATLHAQPSDHAHRDNLGPGVNTMAIEIQPIVSPDGRTLYFDRKNDTANIGGTQDDDDIYFSTLQADGKWSIAKNAGAPLNSKGSDILFWISPDGNAALVYNSNLVDRGLLGLGIARKSNDQWGAPIPITINNLSSLGEAFYATISPDGHRLLIAFAADTTHADNFDIFSCSSLSDDYLKWSEPTSLSFNSLQFDGAPFVAADNRTMYFASTRAGGLGSSDLYITRRLDETWERWSAPVNLGTTTNTSAYDASLSIDAQGEYAYISGSAALDEEYYGRSDLFRIKLPDTLRPVPVTTVKGMLTNGSKGLSGLIRVESAVTGVEIASTSSISNGTFVLMLACGQRYRLTGTAPGYNEIARELDTRKTCKETTVTLRLHPEASTPVAKSYVLYFDFGSDALTAESSQKLKKYLSALKSNNQSLMLDITGHTDAIGEEGQNQTLSLRRAEQVKAWLEARGVSSANMMAFGRGVTQPVATNDTPQGRAQNRRVEIHIVER